MEAVVHVPLHTVPDGTLSIGSDGIRLAPPAAFVEAQFPQLPPQPVSDSKTMEQPTVASCASVLGDAVEAFVARRQNLIVFSAGTRGTPRRELMFGAASSKGYVPRLVGTAVQRRSGVAMLQAFVVGSGEEIVDALDPQNKEAVFAESAKHGPRLRGLTRRQVADPGAVASAFDVICETVEKHFTAAQDVPDARVLPPYCGDTVVVSLLAYESAAAAEDGAESNSMTFVAIGDSDRPVLCGVSRAELQSFETTQKVLLAAASITSAIRCSRLRVPYSKSKLTTLLRRAYNNERGNPNNELNAPTHTAFFVHLSGSPADFEETCHMASMLKRVSSSAGLVGGLVTRDLAIEKWRLERDSAELREELAIVKAAFDYKPCIVDQPKPVANIAEEEAKRTAAVLKRREEERERALTEARTAAMAEAERYIAEHEQAADVKMGDMEQALQRKRAEVDAAMAEKTKKLRDQERHLEKIRKKRDEEERAATKLKEEIRGIEAEVDERKVALERQRQELQALTNAQAAGREHKQQEREDLRRRQEAAAADRRQQREAWLKNITQANERILRLVHQVEEDRATNPSAAIPASTDTEEQLRADVESIQGYLRKVLALEGSAADAESAESIRRQLETYFAEERKQYRARIADLETKRAKIEVALSSYKSKAQEQQTERRKEKLAEASKKEQHLATLIDQVLLYLQHGVRMTKVSSQGNLRRRFFFLASDLKRLHACDLDETGMPLNRKRPTVTVWLKDVKRVVLGAYTPSFATFAGDTALAAGRTAAFLPTGTGNPEPTVAITSNNLGRMTYRCLGLMLRGGKSLELVCDTDSDFEAWVVALKRVLGFKTPHELRRSREEPRSQVEITWGSSASLRGIEGVEALAPEEAHFCSLHHVPPLIYSNCKRDIVQRSQSHVVTVYDVRMVSSLDLFRSQMLLEFLTESRVLASQ